MTQKNGVIICLAYCLGLLSTSVTWGGYGILALGIAIALGQIAASKARWRRGKIICQPKLWIVAGLISLIASWYLQVRTPQPAVNDISKFITAAEPIKQTPTVTVQGQIISTPNITQSQRGQFWLAVKQLNSNKLVNRSQSVIGKLYVTVPLLQVTGLHQGQAIAVTGVLYQPQPAANPGGFNFRDYLAHAGIFAGFRGQAVSLLDDSSSSNWGWWAIRQRIIRAQVQWLGIPAGPLVSAMVLGGKVVDLPSAVSDLFVQVGLAHALAASGFQVSLILGIVLALTRKFSNQIQFSCGSFALLAFVGLTGPQPSVLRAAFMGFGVLVALLFQRQVKPLGLLLVAVTLLLLINPLWVWNLGLQFSFLATLGLLVTVPPLTKKLDWLPPAIATLVAVPIAAYIWTLPLQLYAFGLVSPYSIVVNIIATIPLSIVSLGAFISAAISLVVPIAGSAVAWLLYYPTHFLISLIEFFAQLPMATVAVGKVSVLQLTVLYGLIGLVWWQRWWQSRWWVAGLMAIALVLTPIWHQATLFRATVLAAGTEPVLVVQDRGKVLLVNIGDENNARFVVLPFLQQQGVNRIDWAIATNSQSNPSNGWLQLLQSLPVGHFYANNSTLDTTVSTAIQRVVKRDRGRFEILSNGKTVVAGSTIVQQIEPQYPIWQLQIQDRTWLLIGDLKPEQQKQLALTKKLPRAEVLWWSGKFLTREIVEIVKPKVAIASTAKLEPETIIQLRKRNIPLFWTRRDGAIQWTPNSKFETTLELSGDRAAWQ